MARPRRGGSLDKRPPRAAWEPIRLSVLERDGYRCRDCGAADGMLEVHHVRPVAQGGDHSPGNLRAVCLQCHQALHHPVPVEVAEWRELLRAVSRG